MHPAVGRERDLLDLAGKQQLLGVTRESCHQGMLVRKIKVSTASEHDTLHFEEGSGIGR